MAARRARRDWIPEDEVEAVARYRAGSTLREIAEWLGRTSSAVWSKLGQHGVEMRPPRKRTRGQA